MDKEAVYQIRVSKALRDAFVKAAAEEDRSGAQLIRDYMRSIVEKRQQGKLDLRKTA